ncbi:MAG: DUF885 domain-containing protein [Sphingomonadaceae bacterium]|nr:DUF885 domain-containing protein [Sphingomonadaceae bacterium]
MNQALVTRRGALTLLGAASASVALGACAHGGFPSTASDRTKDLLDEIAWRLLAARPEEATALGIDKGLHAGLRRKLEDKSPEGVARLASLIESDLSAVRSVSSAGLDSAAQTSLAVIESAYSSALEGFALPYGDVAVGGWRNTPYVVIQNVGAYLDIPRFLDSGHPVRNAGDAEAYLDRLSQMPAQLDGERERIAIAEAGDLVPPDFLLDRTIAQMERTIRDQAAGGILVQSLAKRCTNIPGNWEAHAQGIVTSAVLPALQRQLDALKRLRAAASGAPGMRERPHGSAYYAWSLKAATTTPTGPDDVHAMGMDELTALHARMDPILRKLGYSGGSVGERMAALSHDPQFRFPEGGPGRAEIMRFVRERIDWITGQMPRAFRTLTSGNVEVRRLPLAEEPGAPTAYGGPGSIDGSIPGKMWINLGTTQLHRKYDLPTLVHHETVPGHVWQGEYANRLPLIRSILQFNPYSEGWALYGEQLADELGAYEDDPVGKLGYLQSLAFRACRMVVDTGLHAKGWSRERAVEFFVTRNGNTRAEVSSEVDRYCSWPGQACGYKIGHSEILRQRDRAISALKGRYDLRDFNQSLVDGGNVPLNVLADNVTRYIEDNV